MRKEELCIIVSCCVQKSDGIHEKERIQADPDLMELLQTTACDIVRRSQRIIITSLSIRGSTSVMSPGIL